MSTKIDRLIKMANDIADFFNAESDKEIAANGVMKHIQRSWDPRMRKELARHCREAGGEGLSPLAAAALKKLIANEAKQLN